jgi:hypothetical protein
VPVAANLLDMVDKGRKSPDLNHNYQQTREEKPLFRRCETEGFIVLAETMRTRKDLLPSIAKVDADSEMQPKCL